MIVEKLNRIIEALDGYGVPATLDARNLNPPAVWVSANRVIDHTICLEPTITVDLVLAAPDTGATHALTVLDDMLSRTLDAATDVCQSVEDVSLNDSATLSGAGTLPAFVVTVTI